MTTRRRTLLAAAGASLAAPGFAPALAQTNRWPERPVEIVVGFVAGGATDLDARAVAPLLEKRIGGSVVVVNRPGAGGEVALASVARARPDGHVLATTNMPGLLTIPIERQAQFKLDDFAGIANIVTDPTAITVHEDSPYRTLADFIAAAKARPEALTYASPGVGTDDHLQLVLLQAATDTRFTHVVFQGDPQLLAAVLGRQVDSMGLNLGPVSANRDKLRTLAMAGAARSPFRPDVPTLKELGFDIEMASERGLVAPAATPPAVLAKLREAMGEVVQDPDFVRIMRSRYTEPRYEEGSAWFTRLRGLQEGYRTLWQRTPWNQR
ncbi:tripartite tricarboxylate transporter substrate binding protein [Neoroseomonas oryzicola]|uniref:Tripartite tricarboxylate transporter substrate binding protein n=1 Tax=Neoroseomonas oryzicola TaxID=535904 RepID=A0A9X9WHW9_9PROT|nr:tripartite tricarboxylate transporter substrate binding protein [Neoroseomonas oryzicola]MBR0659929.1 tripartite tricarboxylate transporter substrate binding protein [Neoroseomonas oryzicola]NKE16472.1 tripartite tricarboxylate transporter substrate binding protein [Neoroseomonas oryzicola]